MRFVQLDIAHEYDGLLELLRSERPEAVVHFAEQRAAPYSMKSSATKRYTVDNNVNGTHNLLAASGYVVAQRRAAVASKATGRLVELAVLETEQMVIILLFLELV